ncbi:MAG: DciA family protein [Siculibacillus sp.]|nr:DciA family protein [Siculibacillus sp.]
MTGREEKSGRRPRGPVAVADLVDDALKPAIKRRGFASTDLFRNWAEIVGPVFARVTQPERLSWPRRLEDGGEQGFEPATLTVRCEGSRALLLQHEAPVVVERINAVFGFPAVARLRIVQKPLVRPQVARPPRLRPLTPTQEAHVAEITAEIEDEGLKRALVDLGRAVLGSKK